MYECLTDTTCVWVLVHVSMHISVHMSTTMSMHISMTIFVCLSEYVHEFLSTDLCLSVFVCASEYCSRLYLYVHVCCYRCRAEPVLKGPYVPWQRTGPQIYNEK